MKGLFITFEGIEGSGKSTQIAQLNQVLKNQGYPLLITREPGGSPIGELIRQIILDRGHQAMSPKAELLLYLASRAQHLAEVIEPALKEGKIVITDRFADATFAYQGYGRGESLDKIRELNRYVLNTIEPQLTFLLDIEVVMGLSRVGRRGSLNRLDQEEIAFHQRVREGYLTLAKENPQRIHLLSGAKSPEASHKEIMEILTPHLQRHHSTRNNG